MFCNVCTRQEEPCSIHVGVRDGNGTLIELEVFSFKFEGLDGLPRCLAGLRESSDLAPPAPQLPRETSSGEQLGTLGPQIVVLNALDGQLQIHSISEGLARVTGAAPGAKFGRYVQNSRAFNMWIQKQMMSFTDTNFGDDSEGGSSGNQCGSRSRSSYSRSSNQTRPVKKSFPVRLRPASGSAHWHLRATCECVLDDGDDHLSCDADPTLRVPIMVQDTSRWPGSFRSTHIQSRSICSDFEGSCSSNSSSSKSLASAEIATGSSHVENPTAPRATRQVSL